MSRPEVIGIPFIPKGEWKRVQTYIGRVVSDHTAYATNINSFISQLALQGLPAKKVDVVYSDLTTWVNKHGHNPNDGDILALYTSDREVLKAQGLI
jgi:hypothetical protein